ncbi:arylsulfatase [Rufibacter glacialis]|nr:arylsulfatase [Rufibacter glacialis]
MPQLCLALFLFCGSFLGNGTQTLAQGKKSSYVKPNIIFILADDMGYGDLGSYGQTKIKTPHLDQLAAGGRRYTQFYAGSTVCAPSRAALMTGQHTGHTYIRGNGEVPLPPTEASLPILLQKSGYRTGMVGKWGLGLKGTTGAPEKQGWDFFTGHLHHLEGHFQQADSLWTLREGKSQRIAVAKDVYLNELFTQEALRFVDDQQKSPFFLYVSYTLPHAELRVPDRYLQPYLTAEGQSVFAPEKAHPAGQHYRAQPFPKAAYAAMVTSIDDYVGQILRKLEERGLTENTLVIFTSDNGTHVEGGRKMEDAMQVFQSSGLLRGVKRDLYEGGIRVPFLVSWKGHVKPGTTSTYLGAFWDILPTFAALAGAPTPAGIDGLSFLPDLLGKKMKKQHEVLYWEFGEGGFKQAVRKGDWKAIRFYKDGRPTRTELYRLDKDLGEKQDLAASNVQKVKEMEALMDQQHTTPQNSLFQIK